MDLEPYHYCIFDSNPLLIGEIEKLDDRGSEKVPLAI